MANRSRDWLEQAHRDLGQAEESRASERHEWACFAAHQAAEKALKGLNLHLGQEAWGHVVAKLLRALPADVPDDLVDKAHVLDAHYIPARYPNSHAEGAPFEHYGARQSEEAIAIAGEIVAFAGAQMAERD
ncbi:MAG: HEPN domain-containing protein [Actinomycetota bacterium]|nr:HEPN domain-containing protein [Actinomycetota bacterium]